MTSKLIPVDPAAVMVIRKVTPQITTFSAPFARFGLFKVGGRGTMVRLANGSLAVFSPTALTPEVRSAVAAAGDQVAYLAALDFEHHIFLSEWARAFPSAKVIGVEGLPEKREADPATRGTKFDTVFTARNRADTHIDPAFDAEFSCEYVPAHGNKELVFCHRPSRTMIEADLMFSLPATEQYSRCPPGQRATDGLLTRFFTGIMSTAGPATWQKRFIWYAASSKDRPSFAGSVRTIDTWDFDRIIPCHGDVIESGGKDIFRKVMEWHLTAARGGR